MFQKVLSQNKKMEQQLAKNADQIALLMQQINSQHLKNTGQPKFQVKPKRGKRRRQTAKQRRAN